jgi:hypothetical protein
MRDEALADVTARLPACSAEQGRVHVPAHHRGAYVFRNGIREALNRNGLDSAGCELVPDKEGDSR